MGYFSEIRSNWRPLAAAVIGLASGMSIIGTITNVMAPHFIKEFGWTNEEFAYVNSLSIFTVIMLPIAGRLADVIGVRRTAAIGVVTLPLTFLVLSFMTGDIRVYIALFLVQAAICITTTGAVYSRVVVQWIKNARGLALGIAASAPAITGLVGGPILNQFVLDHGWRAGYQALAAVLFTAGMIALWMVPPHGSETKDDAPKPRARAWHDYPLILRQPAFWILLTALILINLSQTIAIAQFGLVMLDNGVSSAQIGIMVSALSAGTLAGRLLCGAALDHFPTHWIATLSMLLPGFGLYLLASDMNTFAIVATAVLLYGLAYGAEGDIVAFLVVRVFGVRIYGSVMGLMTAAMSIGTASGAAFLGYTLRLTGGYTLFLTITGTTAIMGALMFQLLPAASRYSERRAALAA